MDSKQFKKDLLDMLISHKLEFKTHAKEINTEKISKQIFETIKHSLEFDEILKSSTITDNNICFEIINGRKFTIIVEELLN